MIAELLCVLAGHDSSLFTPSAKVVSEFLPLLHPGEVETLESLSRLAQRAARLRDASKRLCAANKTINEPTIQQKRRGNADKGEAAPSEYLAALGSALSQILLEFDTLVVDTESRVLKRDDELVGAGSFVPISSIRAIFSPWDTPLATLDGLIEELQAGPFVVQQPSSENGATPSNSFPPWPPGPLIDLLLLKAQTGVRRVSEIMTQLSLAVERVWRLHLVAFVVHGSLSAQDPLAVPSSPPVASSLKPNPAITFSPLVPNDIAIPSCVSPATRQSILYIGKAVSTVKSQGQHRNSMATKQVPRSMTLEHVRMLESVLPHDGYAFDRVITEIRTQISEFLWTHVLLEKDVEGAIEALANYFLLRNGEFAVSLIREIERLKVSRLTARVANIKSAVIREQDLSLALLRASLGTSAEHDQSLSKLRFSLPSGPLRPLLPSLAPTSADRTITNNTNDAFFDLLLGTPLVLNYNLSWPLDLFLIPSDVQIYSALFSYLSSIRRAQQITYECWVGLSNAQRSRRRWTGQNEGGSAASEERERQKLLRCGWGVMRQLLWFSDTLSGYLMSDVVSREYERFRSLLRQEAGRGSAGAEHQSEPIRSQTPVSSEYGTARPPSAGSTHRSTASHPRRPASHHLDFTTLRALHSSYLNNLMMGTLLANQTCASILRGVLELCDRFVAQVERWGGDILPALLFEGSITRADSRQDAIIKERWEVVKEINEELEMLLTSFYDHLSHFGSATSDPSMTMNPSVTIHTVPANSTIRSLNITLGGKTRKLESEAEGEVRRNVEHLLLRLDFNMGFSRPRKDVLSGVVDGAGNEILRQGGFLP